jgi:hypothetical protein
MELGGAAVGIRVRASEVVSSLGGAPRVCWESLWKEATLFAFRRGGGGGIVSDGA